MGWSVGAEVVGEEVGLIMYRVKDSICNPHGSWNLL